MLSEFDAAYRDLYYASEFDGLDGVNAAGIVSAAVVLARTLARLAAGIEVLQVRCLALYSFTVELVWWGRGVC